MEFGGVFYPSHYAEMPAYSNALEGPFVNELIDNLQNVMNDRNDTLVGSDWVYLGVAKLFVTFIKTGGRDIRNVNEYVPYPKGKRGNGCVINPNYRVKPYGIRSKEPMAECLGWAIRCYKIYNELEDIKLKDDFIKDLATKDIYPSDYWHRMLAQDLILPDDVLRSGAFQLKDFKSVEKLNNIPIALYNLEKGKKGDHVSVSCILAPKSELVDRGIPICHLLMINSTHVAFIPNMKKYMKAIFADASKNSKAPYNRCHICFFLFKTEK